MSAQMSMISKSMAKEYIKKYGVDYKKFLDNVTEHQNVEYLKIEAKVEVENDVRIQGNIEKADS